MGSCVVCGSRPPVDALFCPACGTPVDQGWDAPTGGLLALEPDLDDPVAGGAAFSGAGSGDGVLIITRGPGTGSRFALVSNVVVLGRHPRSDVLLDDISVSRRHAELRRASAGHVLRDLGSLNGTYLNGARVDESALRHGDELQIGRFKLAFLLA